MKNDKIRDHNELRLSWRSSRRRDRLHRRCPSTPLLVASLKRASSAAIATEALADSTPTHFSTFRMDEHEVDRKRKSPADGDGEKCKEPMAAGTATSREDTVRSTDAAMVFSEGSVSVSSSKGYRTARSTLLVNEGAWYFEVIVAHLGDSGHARVGWSTNMCELNAPVGFDEHGYGYCDVFGEKVHRRNREPFGEAYAAGDVLGCYIYIKPAESDIGMTKSELDGRDGVDRVVVEDRDTRIAQVDSLGESAERSQKTSEEADAFRADGAGNSHSAEDAILEDEVEGARQALAPTTPSSSTGNCGCVAFAKNGVFQGVAYHLTKRDGFSPSVSLFTLGKVEPVAKAVFNFGPDFVHAVSDFGDLPSPKPLSEAASLGAVSVREEEKSGTVEEIPALIDNNTQLV